MLRMNIANYLIGELSNNEYYIPGESKSKDVIDNLVESWERKKYLLPKLSKDDNNYYDNIHFL